MKRKKRAYTSSSDDDVPLASSQVRSAAVPMPGAMNATTVSADGKIRANGKARKLPKTEDSEDDVPLGTKLSANGKSNGKSDRAPPKKRAKKMKTEDEEEASAPEKKPNKRKKASKPKVKKQSDDDSEDDKPLTDRTPKKLKSEPKNRTAKAKKDDSEAPESSAPPTKKGRKEEEEEEEVFKWWEAEDPNGDGSIKWSTLEHSGVLFPPPYDPLPTAVRMKYAGTTPCISSQHMYKWGY